MRVIQMVSNISFGDAIGNDVLALNDLLNCAGYETAIYAEVIDPRVAENHTIFSALPLPGLNKDDVLIYHLCINTPVIQKIKQMKCRKVAIYHNVTPHEFFLDHSFSLFTSCKDIREELKKLAGTFDYCIAVSSFNRDDLINNGFTCQIDVRPILIPFGDYEKPPSRTIIDKYNDNNVNIFFLGRVVPNKKQEDVIAAFSCYVKNHNPNARLFIVGSSEGMESYREQLDEYISLLGIENVIFTEKVPFDEILAYYKIADVFLCMSEHEGFCVPLVEAMYFDVPIVAYASSAIPETLAGSGVLLYEKDPLVTAGIIDKLVTDENLRNSVIEGQRKRLMDFSYEKTSKLFLEYIENFIACK
ncbi:MAG: glycosyltransferase family 4 protein [Oscillospiraceae bacterium]|nr:glycosyltransferase family 4 protein [Oscillospiraceae bacterium]